MTDLKGRGYDLVTAARNEEPFIRYPLESVIAQRTPPRHWIIVSDGSTDGTDEIVKSYSLKYPFIRLIRRDVPADKPNFASKVHALRTGFAALEHHPHDFIGILDADVSFEAGYYESVLYRFQTEARLGIAGGFVQDHDGSGLRRPFNRVGTVAGCIQMFRRECFEDIGGLTPIPHGGEDTCAEIAARMNGWNIRAFPELQVLHHKPTRGRGIVREGIRFGKAEWSLGYHPLFELLKCVSRLRERPYVIMSCLRLLGYVQGTWSSDRRPVPDDLVRFLRKEQMGQIKQRLKLV
jgi:biofilm PGA synthesis N-glycosyltransferase PgaC